MEFHPIDAYLHLIETAPLFMKLFMIAGLVCLGLLLVSLAIMIFDVIFDCFSVDHVWDPFRAAHILLIFPIMLLFIVLRFYIQRRTKMTFYFFEFTSWEVPIIKWLGYGFHEDFWEYECQNAFGAKWEGVDCTTDVYRRPSDSYKNSIWDR